MLGSIIDPMADKTLVTTLVVCLTYKGLLPRTSALMADALDWIRAHYSAPCHHHLRARLCAVDVGLLPPLPVAPPTSESLFFTSASSAPANAQRTLKRYFDPTMPSAEVKPTQISKVGFRCVGEG